MSRGARKDRVKPVRERRCVATGDIALEAELLRVALAPDGSVVPDVAAKLPGRGAWVRADRALVDKAVKKRLFNRAFEGEAAAPDDLADLFEALLAARALSCLGLARRAGRLAVGFDAVRLALAGKQAPAWRIEARDGSRDGRTKLDGPARAWPHLKTVSCFEADALGAALGRSGIVHAVLESGPEADGFTTVIGKLSGFRIIDPLGQSAQDG